MDEREMMMQKRRKWMEERELEEKLSGMGINEQALQDDKGKLLTEITLKLTQKFKSEMGRNDKELNHQEMKIEKAISKEIESNTCPICLELMLPPEHSPILLFPCGHTFCRVCITAHTQKNKMACPYCRARIGSQAVNISLQNLICIHTNNKHLLDKYNEEQEETAQKKEAKEDSTNNSKSLNQYQEELQLCEIRYKIVKEEKHETEKTIRDLEKNVQVQNQVVQELKKKKEEAFKKLEAIKKEMELIDGFITQSEREQEKLQKGIDENKIKLELIEGTLEPIKLEKEKCELLLKGLKAKGAR